MNVFTQGVIWKSVNLIGNTRVIFSNRINHVNLQAACSLKKDTREKLKTIPEKPKRPLNSYMKFVKENRDQIAEKNPNLDAPGVLRKIAEAWKAVDSTTKQKYMEDFHKEALTYKEDVAKYTNSLSNEQKQILSLANEEKKKMQEKRALKKVFKDTGRPKMPVPPFFRYLIEQQKMTNKKIVELSAELKEKWSQFSPEEKGKYDVEYRREKEKYEHDLEKWEIQMIKQGHLELVREKTLKNKVSSKAFHDIKSKKSQ